MWSIGPARLSDFREGSKGGFWRAPELLGCHLHGSEVWGLNPPNLGGATRSSIVRATHRYSMPLFKKDGSLPIYTSTIAGKRVSGTLPPTNMAPDRGSLEEATDHPAPCLLEKGKSLEQ